MNAMDTDPHLPRSASTALSPVRGFWRAFVRLSARAAGKERQPPSPSHREVLELPAAGDKWSGRNRARAKAVPIRTDSSPSVDGRRPVSTAPLPPSMRPRLSLRAAVFGSRPTLLGRRMTSEPAAFTNERSSLEYGMQMYPSNDHPPVQKASPRNLQLRTHILRGRILVYYSVATCLLAAFSVGTHRGWMLPVLREDLNRGENGRFGLSVNEKNFIEVAMQLGMFVTPLPFGILMDRVGRRPVLLMSAFPLLCAWVLAMIATTPLGFFFARFVAGMGAGIVYCAAPVYLAEVAEYRTRGIVVTLFTLVMNLGIFLAYIVGPSASYSVAIAIYMIFPLLFFITFMPASETPAYYLLRDKSAQTRVVLSELRDNRRDEREEEYEYLVQSINYLPYVGPGFQDMCGKRATKWAFATLCLLMIIKELSGTDIIFSTQNKILGQSGPELESKHSFTVLAAMQVLGAAASVGMVDVIGRRPLLLASQVGVTLSLTVIAMFFTFSKEAEESSSSVSWLLFIFLLLENALYGLGLGPLPWTLLPELLPPAVRASVASAACIVSTFFNVFERRIFEELKGAWGLASPFWACTGASVSGAVLAYFVLRETKGRHVYDIVRELEDGWDLTRAPERMSSQTDVLTKDQYSYDH